MDPFLPTLTQFGGLGVLALFAYLLLKSVLKQQEKLAELLNNHLTQLLERQKTTNDLLQRIVAGWDQHESKAEARHLSLVNLISSGGQTPHL